ALSRLAPARFIGELHAALRRHLFGHRPDCRCLWLRRHCRRCRGHCEDPVLCLRDHGHRDIRAQSAQEALNLSVRPPATPTNLKEDSMNMNMNNSTDGTQKAADATKDMVNNAAETAKEGVNATRKMASEAVDK